MRIPCKIPMSGRYIGALMLGLLLGAGIIEELRPATGHAAAPQGRYSYDTSGVVYDNVTKLSWQRVMSTSTFTWAGAKTYCEGLDLAGFTDWRLPSVAELHTLVDTSTSWPSIDSVAFPDTQSKLFWTSTIRSEDSDFAWVVRFHHGCSGSNGINEAAYARCVRP